MISKKVEKAILNQIMVEEHSSRLYLAMASLCDANGYPGAAAFLYHHSDEERMHQTKLMKYLNGKGGNAELPALEKPRVSFTTLRQMFEEILKHEGFVTKSINELYELALKEKDYATGQFLLWYIEEQAEEEGLFGGILDKFRLGGGEKGGLLLMDKMLGAMAAGE
jgi:ferritin